MPYNEEIETRINTAISDWEHTELKRMFGGICHLLNGNMFCGVYKDFLILRLGEKQAVQALTQPFISSFDITEGMGHGRTRGIRQRRCIVGMAQ